MGKRTGVFQASLLVLNVVLFTLPGRGTAQTPSSTEKAIVAYVEQHSSEAVDTLARVVNINSGTMNHDGVRQVGRVFEEELAALGFSARWIAMPEKVNRAGHLFAERRGSQGKRLLLIGHLDTVFERDSPFQRFDRRGSTATGPGVVDMKGGDVVILYALKALQHVGALEDTHITVALTGDEEAPGKPLSISRRDLIEAARDSDIALGFEAGQRGTITVARRGVSGWALRISGTQGHSSGIFVGKSGSGAIFEAARILHAFHEEVRGEQFLTFNPGFILGGDTVDYDSTRNRGSAFGKTNVIAQTTIVRGDLRFISEAQKERTRTKMRVIVTRNNLPGTSATITFHDAYPAMPPNKGNQALLRLFDRVSRDLGFGAVEAYDPGKRGAADVSFVAPYVSGLDGLGVYGSGAHSDRERLDVASLARATQQAALLLYRLTRQPRDSLPRP